jgi:hypothetical protein
MELPREALPPPRGNSRRKLEIPRGGAGKLTCLSKLQSADNNKAVPSDFSKILFLSGTKLGTDMWICPNATVALSLAPRPQRVEIVPREEFSNR